MFGIIFLNILDRACNLMINNNTSLNNVVGWKTIFTVIHKNIESNISASTLQYFVYFNIRFYIFMNYGSCYFPPNYNI